MCGICGLVNRPGAEVVDRRVLEELNAQLHHRGPDSSGYYLRENVGLAVQRLAVIDLVSGDQPIANEENTIWVVHNGEIYNHVELRRQLVAQGHRFRTHSDTEVIVHLYEDYGWDCVQHLRGMFAFALWDERDQILLLARDRLGQKPLYYTEQRGALLFASELHSLLQNPHLPRRIDLTAIHDYLSLGYVPDPRTAFQDVHKLPPGHRLLWQAGRQRLERYWDLAYLPKETGSATELKDAVRQALTDSVRVRLRSDVPLGAHLSGGIDSSIVVGLMASMTEQPVKTFSIGFQEEAFSELSFARRIAKKFHTDHHEFVLEPEVASLLPSLTEHFGEPFADPAAIPTWHLARLTRQSVTVVLNGDGGDEAFGGYQRYYADPIANGYQWVPAWARHHLIDPMLQILPVQDDRPRERSAIMALRQLGRAAQVSRQASMLRWAAGFDEPGKQRLYLKPVGQELAGLDTTRLLEGSFRRAVADNRLDRTMYADLQNYLPGALLTKVDRLTMAHALEARSPFLDHQVVELAARLPTSWKVRRQQTKRILREAFADLLPPDVIGRAKAGFAVPLGLWFRGTLRELAGDLLLDPHARLWNLMQPQAVAALLREHWAGDADHGQRLWMLIVLETWLSRYEVSW